MLGTPIILALAGVGVCLLIILALRYGFTGVPRLEGNAEAVAIANGLAGGFDVQSCIMDRNGHCALLIDTQGRRAVVMPHGAHFVARLLGNEALVTRQGKTLSIQGEGWRAQLATESDNELDKVCAISWD